MEKLATDIYSFKKLRENAFTYVDKTAQILPLVTLLYQTGNLTIKGTSCIGDFVQYELGFPNLEVENSFLGYLAPELDPYD